ncbi:cucumisin-like [Carica papaya]|uniref:cucumisin-like n=1 Tax=Carica papaya TaxID=3649 RepID=UPI000B8CD05C|nr:cucumisin-like [Carica papaya]
MPELHSFLYSLLLAAFLLTTCHAQQRKVHIVYMGELPKGDFSVASTHHSMLKTVLGSKSSVKDSLIYSYGRSFNGFAANLTDEEVESFSDMEGVVSVIPNHILKLHTTRSWDFMGISKDTVGPPKEGNVIVGLLDTGIWPESESFNDDGFTAPPAKWKGKCTGANFTCNKCIMDAKKHDDREFAYGSGHINPEGALDPGLVYDASEGDYINFLCKQGYNTTTLRKITWDNSSVCTSTEPGRAWDLNYPSFSVAVEDGQQILAIFNRTVTNVGSENSIYTASMYIPTSIGVTVEPSVLSFSKVGEQKSFLVMVYGPPITQQPIISGAIMWKDGIHVVRSPLVIYTILPGSTYSSSYSLPHKTPNFEGLSMYHKNGILTGK